ncbi:MAG: hypothetical protein AABX23_00395 [Nanoarchaeota archaeon]
MISDDLLRVYRKFRKGRTYNLLKKINTLRRVRNFLGSTYGTWLLSRFRLHGDTIHLETLKKIVKDYKITSIVETGTFLGYTTALFAENFPNLQVYTAEINSDFYKKSQKNLKKFKNVHNYLGTSPKFLNHLLKNNLIGERPLFYLDAHWLDDWPLEDELKIISKNIPSAVISIDDFKVEGDRRFVYDKYGNKECSLDLANPNLEKGKYNLLFPNYNHKKLFKGKIFAPNLIGYVIIFRNMKMEFEDLKKTNLVKSNYLDKSYLIKTKKSFSKKK